MLELLIVGVVTQCWSERYVYVHFILDDCELSKAMSHDLRRYIYTSLPD
jgi:hypothetical protein